MVLCRDKKAVPETLVPRLTLSALLCPWRGLGTLLRCGGAARRRGGFGGDGASHRLRDEKVLRPWCVAVATLRDVTHLRISATGLWEPIDGQLPPFPPDGHMGLRVDASLLLLPDVPVGALLGRIRGSSASLTTVPSAATDALAASQVFPIGAHCIVGVGAALVGPLFVGFNWRSRPLQVKELTVCVEGAAPL